MLVDEESKLSSCQQRFSTFFLLSSSSCGCARLHFVSTLQLSSFDRSEASFRLQMDFLASTISFSMGVPRRTCSATPRGMNDSVCTQCLGVAFGEAQKTLLLGCFLTPDPPLVIMQRAAAAARAFGSPQLCFAVRVRDGSGMSSLETLGCAVFPSSPLPSPSFRSFSWQKTSSPPSSGWVILKPSPCSNTASFRSGWWERERVRESKHISICAVVIQLCLSTHLLE